jgi:hypothetical protein
VKKKKRKKKSSNNGRRNGPAEFFVLEIADGRCFFMEKKKNPPLVHVYPQTAWHDDVFVVANKEGLLALQRAVNGALKKGKGVAKVSVADGEGYDVKVLLYNVSWPSKEWKTLALPYTADYTKDMAPAASNTAVEPWELWQRKAEC